MHCRQNGSDSDLLAPTGLDEPPFPPVFSALANALYRATGPRFDHQTFIDELDASRETRPGVT